jgi:fatty acid desaturase
MCNPTDIHTAPTASAPSATITTDSTTASKKISNAQVRKHNTPSSAWCIVENRVLDITSFAKRHPGGDTILLAAGKDATVLFKTYHPRGVPATLLDKLQIGETSDVAPSFYSWENEFYTVLRKRVVARLEERGLSRRGGREIWIKALGLLAGFWFFLLKMYMETRFGVAALYAAAMGVFAAFIGTCIQHDGNHGAFAFGATWNKIAGWTLDMIGASAFTWEFQHMLGHHPYTNLLDTVEEDRKEKGEESPIEDKDQESDPDVFSSFPAMRMHPYNKPAWFHKYQHIYGPILFAFMTLSKVFQQDMEVILNGHLYHIDAMCRYGSKWNVFRFWFMKVLSAGYMIGLPCYFHGVARGLGLFLIGHFTCGELLATMFIVNHVIEGVSYAQKSDTPGTAPRPKTITGETPMNRLETKVPLNDWAAVQCQTSVNWSAGSWFWNHFSGGLSHQIEHHLFPSICHTNYVYIQDVVESTCQEYGVPYQNEKNLFVAYFKMLRHLKFMGSGRKEL